MSGGLYPYRGLDHALQAQGDGLPAKPRRRNGLVKLTGHWYCDACLQKGGLSAGQLNAVLPVPMAQRAHTCCEDCATVTVCHFLHETQAVTDLKDEIRQQNPAPGRLGSPPNPPLLP